MMFRNKQAYASVDLSDLDSEKDETAAKVEMKRRLDICDDAQCDDPARRWDEANAGWRPFP